MPRIRCFTNTNTIQISLTQLLLGVLAPLGPFGLGRFCSTSAALGFKSFHDYFVTKQQEGILGLGMETNI